MIYVPAIFIVFYSTHTHIHIWGNKSSNDVIALLAYTDLQINIDPGLQAKQLQLKKNKLADKLNEKLANRPGPLELVKDRILEPKLSDIIHSAVGLGKTNEPAPLSFPSQPSILSSSSSSASTPSSTFSSSLSSSGAHVIAHTAAGTTTSINDALRPTTQAIATGTGIRSTSASMSTGQFSHAANNTSTAGTQASTMTATHNNSCSSLHGIMGGGLGPSAVAGGPSLYGGVLGGDGSRLVKVSAAQSGVGGGGAYSEQMDTSTPSPFSSLISPQEYMHGKCSESSSPPAAFSPDYDQSSETSSPNKSPQAMKSPGFLSSFPALGAPLPRIKQIVSSSGGGGKSMSPSQMRKKQQKQQKYRKLRYHEYVPPSKNNSKGGKTNPKPSQKPDSPYSVMLEQQQLFLQLQVLHQQYPNAVVMQKLPDIMNNLKGKEKGASGQNGSPKTSLQTNSHHLPVDQPNKLNIKSIRYDELKVSDLKFACKELGLIRSGKKSELVERLFEHNNGLLPSCALPDASAKDCRKQPTVVATQQPPTTTEAQAVSVSPLSPLSPIFKFPDQSGIHHHHHHQQQQQSSSSSSLSSSRATGGGVANNSKLAPLNSALPQVFPASDLQQQFNEMVERKKRHYINQKAPMSIAPRPELNNMLAIKIPCELSKKKGTSSMGTKEDSNPPLPASPKELLSPEGAQLLLNELMEDPVSTGDIKPTYDPSTSIQTTQTMASSTPSTDSVFLLSNSMPVNAVANPSSYQMSEMRGDSCFFRQPQVLRHRSSVPSQPIHTTQPPSYNSPLIQRSMSFSSNNNFAAAREAPPLHPFVPEVMCSRELNKQDCLMLGRDEGLSTSELMEVIAMPAPYLSTCTSTCMNVVIL